MDRRESSAKDAYHHWSHYHRVLAEVLDDARDGKLTSHWRAELRAYALGLPKLGGRTARGREAATAGEDANHLPALGADGCLIVNQAGIAAALVEVADETERLHQVYACAMLDVARQPAALWEPYVARGDWRAALDQWYADRIAIFEQAHALAGAELNASTEVRDCLPAQQRDVIEARYRAGIHAGSAGDGGWRDWFVSRIESWAQTEQQVKLRRCMMSGDNFSEWEKLPRTWTATDAH